MAASSTPTLDIEAVGEDVEADDLLGLAARGWIITHACIHTYSKRKLDL